MVTNSKPRRLRLAALAGAVPLAMAAALLLPGHSTRPASAAGSPIQHIVVLDLENQSFDHLLGFWCQTATMPDGTTPRCGPGDAMPASVTLSDGSVVTPSDGGDVVPAESHSVQSQLAAIDGGKMDGWQNEQAHSCAAPAYTCISGYTPAQIPNITALAAAGALNDRFFEFSDQPSWMGHMYSVAATTDGFSTDNPVKVPGGAGGPGWGCDSNEVATWGPMLRSGLGDQVVPSCVPDYGLGLPDGGAFRPTPVLNVPTIMDRLGTAGLSWKIYGATRADKAGPGGQYSGYIWSTCPTFVSCLDTPQDGSLVDQSKFFTDAAAGTLPDFSLITAGGQTIGAADSCHNGFSITACDNYIGQVASAVENSPDWSSTALLITFDDYGGFYDSQPPPGPSPDGTAQGIRLPLIAISPYAVPHSTDSTPATFTSILAFIEHNFGLPPLEVSDELAYPLTNMFNLSAPPARAAKPHMVTRPVPKGDRIQWWEAKQDT